MLHTSTLITVTPRISTAAAAVADNDHNGDDDDVIIIIKAINHGLYPLPCTDN